MADDDNENMDNPEEDYPDETEEIIQEVGIVQKLDQLFAFERDASRLELLVRIPYWIGIGIVMYLYSYILMGAMILQFGTILIAGRRSEIINRCISGYLEYYVNVIGYMLTTTDERPNVIPEPVQIFASRESEE
jgi:hypothetical protein